LVIGHASCTDPQSIVFGVSDEPAVVPEQAASWQVEPSFGQNKQP
jgi:hypothetical protein